MNFSFGIADDMRFGISVCDKINDHSSDSGMLYVFAQSAGECIIGNLQEAE